MKDEFSFYTWLYFVSSLNSVWNLSLYCNVFSTCQQIAIPRIHFFTELFIVEFSLLRWLSLAYFIPPRCEWSSLSIPWCFGYKLATFDICIHYSLVHLVEAKMEREHYVTPIVMDLAKNATNFQLHKSCCGIKIIMTMLCFRNPELKCGRSHRRWI